MLTLPHFHAVFRRRASFITSAIELSGRRRYRRHDDDAATLRQSFIAGQLRAGRRQPTVRSSVTLFEMPLSWLAAATV